MNKRSNQLGISHLVLPIIILVAVVGGAGFYVKHHNKSLSSSSEQQSTLSENLPQQLLGVDKIKQIVSDSTNGRTISALKLEKENSDYIYKIRLDNGTVLVFNALTGTQINREAQAHQEDEQELKDASDLEDNFSPKIGIDQAMSIAQDAHSGTIKEIELSGDSGGVYKMEYTDGTKIKISAENGKVVSLKTPESHKQQKANPGSSDSHKSSESSGSSSHKSSSSSGDSNDSNDNTNDSNDDNSGSGGGSDSGGDSGGDNSGSGGGSDDGGN